MMNDIPNHIVLLNDIHPFLKNYIFSVGPLNLPEKNTIRIGLVSNLRDLWRSASEEEIEYKLFIGDSFDVSTLYQDFKVGDIVVMKKMIYRVSRYSDPNNVSYKKSCWLGKKTNGSILFKFIVKEIHPKNNFFKLEYLGRQDFMHEIENHWFQFADFELVECSKLPYKNKDLDIKEGDRVIPNVSHIHYYEDDRWKIKNRNELVKELRVEKITYGQNLKIYGYKNDFYIHDFIKSPHKKEEITYLPESIKMDRISVFDLQIGEVLLPRYTSVRFSKDNGISWSNFTINNEELFIVKEIYRGKGYVGFSNIPYLVFQIDDFFKKYNNKEKKDSVQDMIDDLKTGMTLFPRKNIVSTSINCGNDWLSFKIDDDDKDKFIISNINKTNGNLLFKGIPTMFNFSDFSINEEDDYLNNGSVVEIKVIDHEDKLELPKKRKNKIKNKEFLFDLEKNPDTDIDINFNFNKKQFEF